jgi:hypothetical protein
MMNCRFLWVKLQIEELCQAESDAALHETLDNLPSSLLETYDRIVRRISSKPRGKEKLMLAGTMLSWILCAQRPLKIDELREAVAIQLGDKTLQRERVVKDKLHLLEACSNLIMVEADGAVRLAHHTVRGYLLDETHLETGSEWKSVLRFRLKDTVAIVAQKCLTYLKFSNFDVQLITASHHNIAVSTTQVRPLLSATAGSAARPIALALGAINKKPGRTIQLQIPKRPSQNTKDMEEDYLMLRYITETWHWHLNEWWTSHQAQQEATSETFQEMPTLTSAGIFLTFQREAFFEFRPWWRGPVFDDSKFRNNLYDWAIEADYAAFCQVLLEKSQGSASDRRASTGFSDCEAFLLQACEAGSFRVLHWFARRANENVLRHRFFDPATPPSISTETCCRLLSRLDLRTFTELDAVFYMLRSEQQIDNVLTQMFNSGNLPAIHRFTEYIVITTEKNDMIDLPDLFSPAIKRNDASILACVCSVMAVNPIAIRRLQSEWSTALKLCIAQSKEHCLLAMHVLHTEQLKNHQETVLMKELRVISQSRYANHNTQREWSRIPAGHSSDWIYSQMSLKRATPLWDSANST